LLLDPEDEIVRIGTRVRVRQAGELYRLGELSDGYQSVLALAGDIMMGMADKWERMDLAEGVVLVDEIEAHLHPMWKLEIASRLRCVFPKVQFMVTTHDPLCLRGLHPGEIAVLRKAAGSVSVEIVKESIDHLRADQLLTSPLFGLPLTRDPRFQERTERY